jgi:hypothetical protein
MVGREKMLSAVTDRTTMSQMRVLSQFELMSMPQRRMVIYLVSKRATSLCSTISLNNLCNSQAEAT